MKYQFKLTQETIWAVAVAISGALAVSIAAAAQQTDVTLLAAIGGIASGVVRLAGPVIWNLFASQ